MLDKAELLSRPINYAVVQLPERKFPGVVIQGDTLHSIVNQISEMQRLLKVRELDDLGAELEDLRERLSEALGHYEKICEERHIALPYPSR